MTGFSRVFSRVPGLVVLVALMATVTGLPAFAADNHIQRYGEKDKDDTQTEKDAKTEAERAYQRSLGAIPTQKASDPWGIARSEEKAAPKTASPKPKAKSTAAKTDSAAKQ